MYKTPSMKRKDTHIKPEKIYSFEEADSRLYDHFRHHGFEDFPHDQRRQLVQFYQLLMTHQLRDNVTRLVKFRDIAIKHFIDSLIVTRFTKLEYPLLDVGTGPGFPGIPLKIANPHGRVVLAEGVRRRVDFLKAVRDEMGLKDLDVIGRNIDNTFMLPMKNVITRALEDVGQTLDGVSQSLEIGGRVIFMKGPNAGPETEAARKKWKEFYELDQDIPYELPNTPHKRRLVIFRKIKTPEIEE